VAGPKQKAKNLEQKIVNRQCGGRIGVHPFSAPDFLPKKSLSLESCRKSELCPRMAWQYHGYDFVSMAEFHSLAVGLPRHPWALPLRPLLEIAAAGKIPRLKKSGQKNGGQKNVSHDRFFCHCILLSARRP
jgi:hypothetical protein